MPGRRQMVVNFKVPPFVRKLTQELRDWMNAEQLTTQDVAYLISVCPRTVGYWLEGRMIPNRDNAMRLLSFEPKIHTAFERIAQVEMAQERMADVSKLIKKRRATAA